MAVAHVPEHDLPRTLIVRRPRKAEDGPHLPEERPSFAAVLMGVSVAAHAGPLPPCAGSPTPAFGELNGAPQWQIWSASELRAERWQPAECLGWSGDTVHCQARGYFGGAKEGFERLREHLKMIKPTTVICCYGANESWKGEPGVPDFRKGYEKLIDMIRETTSATVVLMTPPATPKATTSSNDDILRY